MTARACKTVPLRGIFSEMTTTDKAVPESNQEPATHFITPSQVTEHTELLPLGHQLDARAAMKSSELKHSSSSNSNTLISASKEVISHCDKHLLLIRVYISLGQCLY